VAGSEWPVAIDLRFVITRTVMVNVGVMDEKQRKAK
jgi:hypothetical protein